jgi:arylsulfatase A
LKIQCAALLMISNLIAGNPFAANAESERPNIVVVLADDMEWGDSGTYGHLVIKTPNLDKLASQGVKLTQCYSTCGVCSPSRSAILSGRHPYRNGVWRTQVSLPGDRVALRIGH